MPNSVYLGSNFNIVFDAMTSNVGWNELTIEESQETAPAKPAASKFMRRAAKCYDAKITVKGFASDDSGKLKLATVHGLLGKAPSALTVTDDAGTPVTQLRAAFFTDYPLTAWRVDKVNATLNDEPSEWSIELLPNYDTAVRS